MDEVSFSLITIKITIGFLSLFFVTKLLGRLQIQQFTPFYFVSAIFLGELLGNTIYEDKIKIHHFLYSLVLWSCLLFLMAFLTIKYNGLKGFLEGNPVILIRKGIIDKKQLKKNLMDITQLQSMLRRNSVFSIREVEYAILEKDGSLSVLRKSRYDKPVKQDLNLPESPVNLPITLIIDGDILWDNLKQRGFDDKWLRQQLFNHGIKDEKEVLFAEWRDSEGLFINRQQ